MNMFQLMRVFPGTKMQVTREIGVCTTGSLDPAEFEKIPEIFVLFRFYVLKQRELNCLVLSD